jgi:hypothetical protein
MPKKRELKKILIEFDDKPKSSVLKVLFGKRDELLKQKVENTFEIFKQDDVANVEAKRLVYGIVLKPNIPDAHGDIMTEDDIMWSAHNYMMNFQYVGEQHQDFADAAVVESYIAPIEFTLNGRIVPKGAWVVAIKIVSDDLWMKIISGVYTAFSTGGIGMVQELP